MARMPERIKEFSLSGSDPASGQPKVTEESSGPPLTYTNLLQTSVELFLPPASVEWGACVIAFLWAEKSGKGHLAHFCFL